jgi:membrane-bound metal-dependent hydrolase YbcI (DUF457 family)
LLGALHFLIMSTPRTILLRLHVTLYHQTFRSMNIQTIGNGSSYWFYFLLLVFNATFSNISAISWRPVLVVEEAGVPGENHRPWTSNCWTLLLAAASWVLFFCNLQSRAWTHAVLVIGLYELLGNYPTHWATRALSSYWTSVPMNLRTTDTEQLYQHALM